MLDRTVNAFRSATLSVCLFIAAALSSNVNAQTVILRVDGDNGSAVQNGGLGGSWGAGAHKYLQDALAHAKDLLSGLEPPEDVQIWVAATDPGNPYRPTHCSEFHTYIQNGGSMNNWGGFGYAPGRSFHLQNNVEIYGGFEGGETALEQRKPAENITVLSGDIDGDDDSGQASSLHGVAASVTPLTAGAHINQTAIISGFIVRSTHRPAFVADGAQLHVLNCVFSSSAPAAVHLRSDAEVVFYGCAFDSRGHEAIAADDDAMSHCVDD